MTHNCRFTLSVATTMLAVLMASAQSHGSGYNPFTSYTISSSPYFVAVGDFNNDGIPDLVTANYTGDNISVLLGNGNGSFQSAKNYTAGSFPISVAVGDFNNDGNLDVAVANNGNNKPGGNLAIMFGKGDGTFQAPVNYSTQGSPFYVAVADLNGDGNLDVVLAAHGAPVQVFLNTGNGTFGSPGLYSAQSNPQSVAIADFNGDGIPDLAVANSQSNTVSILLGNGDGTFKTAVNDTVGTSPAVIGTGDFNADGKIDLAVGNNGSNNISILLGNGDGTFQLQTPPIPSPSPSGLVVTDVNGDSIPDLVVTNQNGTAHSIQTFLGVGNGTFQSPTTYNAGQQPRIVAAADFNHDGAPDLAVACSQGNLNVFMNNGGTYITNVGNPNPANVGQSVTFTTTVAYSIPGLGTPTGAVTFYNGGSLLGTGTLNSSGVASYTDSSGFSTEGTYTIYANYSGDSNYNPNSAPPLTETVSSGVPVVVLTPSTLTFAAQLVNTTSPAQNVTLMNTGGGPLTITSITASGNFSSPSNTCGSTVLAGGSCTISVTFTPTQAGARSGQLSVSDNAGGSPQTVALSGQGTVLTFSPTSLTFPSQKVGTTSPAQTVTVTNHGAKSVTISNIEFAGGNLNDFAQTSTCGTSLAGDSSCTISVTFTPHAKGSRASTLVIYDTGGGSPQEVPVSGTGSST